MFNDCIICTFMVYLFFSLLGILKSYYKKNISLYLFLLLLFSSIAAILVGRQPNLKFEALLYQTYIATILYMLFSSFANYYRVYSIDANTVNIRRLKVIEWCIRFPSILVVIIDIYILIAILPYLITGYIVVNEFKNEGGVDSMTMFAGTVPHVLITITNLFSPLGYLCLSMHFYYLTLGRLRTSVFYLLLSTVIPLSGLISLSRSSTASYTLLYIGMMFMFYPMLEDKIKRILKRILILVGVVVVCLFAVISTNKFGDKYIKKSENRAYINEYDNPTLYSLFDYCGQWQELSLKPLEVYDSDKLGYGLYNSSGIGVYFLKMIYGSEYINDYYKDKMSDILNHDEWYGFHGAIVMTILDFGYCGSFIFFIIFCVIVKRNAPRNGILHIKSLLILPLMLPFCVTFFSGNAYSSIVLDLAIIYAFIVWELIKKRYKRKIFCEC